jgi:hypothetical protein
MASRIRQLADSKVRYYTTSAYKFSDQIWASFGKEGSSTSGRFPAWATLARLLDTHPEAEELLPEPVSVEDMMGPLFIAILLMIRSSE